MDFANGVGRPIMEMRIKTTHKAKGIKFNFKVFLRFAKYPSSSLYFLNKDKRFRIPAAQEKRMTNKSNTKNKIAPNPLDEAYPNSVPNLKIIPKPM
jgi:hypothetical protein